MLVESFECAEVMSEHPEIVSEAVEIIETLELAGQKQFLSPTKADNRCPYREITAEEAFVYRTLCPQESQLSRYNASPIPLRVLQIAAHATSLGMFKRFLVWDRVSVSVKDPVLVAWTGGEYDWGDSNRCFILARWGEELETFAVLRARAVVAAKEMLISQTENLLHRIRGATESQILSSTPITADWLR